MNTFHEENNDKMMHLYPSQVGIKYCPFCHQETVVTVCSVKSIKTGEVCHIKGRICRPCKSFFTVSMKLLEESLGSSKSSNSYKLHYDFVYGYNKGLYSKIRETIPYIRQYILCSSSGLKAYTITKYMHDVDKANNVLHYTNEISLLLLTAENRKENTVKIDDREYTIERIYSGQDYINILDKKSKVIIETKNNGGLYDPRSGIVQLDALVYTAHCDHLVVMNISYSTKEKVYYIDKKMFERFRKKHGFIICSYGQISGINWNSLNEESLLHQLGYNVRWDNGIEEEERHALLLDIINCGIMDTHKIANHIEYLIQLNDGKKMLEGAVSKWRNDLRFLLEYDKKHDSFIVGESKK